MLQNQQSNGVSVSPEPRKAAWKRWGGLVSVLAVGMVSGAAIMTALAQPAATVYPPVPPGSGCGWGNLKGGLQTPPKLVLAFDQDLNVQGFFGPGGGVGKGGGTLKQSLDVEVEKYNPEWCYKINQVEHCVNY